MESAIYNKSILSNYYNDINNIVLENNNSKYKDKKFKRIEDRVFKKNTYKEKDFQIKIKLEVYYRSNKGNVNDSRYGNYSFKEVENIYNEWLKKNKYKETVKQERRITNDDIRYNVLKRDNYTYRICGMNAKDGAKLEVDHIIHVSKVGKAVMSNLHALCDRCNKGKSNKIGDNGCPLCGGTLVERNGKYGKFLGCSNYLKCGYTKKL